MLCPRRVGLPQGPLTEGEDHWRSGSSFSNAPKEIAGVKLTSCSFCGSLNPDVLIELLQRGEAVVGPTDKFYKIYVSTPVSKEDIEKRMTEWEETEVPKHVALMKAHNHPESEVEAALERESKNMRMLFSSGPNFGKFYTPHFSDEQGDLFRDLVAGGKVQVGYPGYFYTKLAIPMTRRPKI